MNYTPNSQQLAEASKECVHEAQSNAICSILIASPFFTAHLAGRWMLLKVSFASKARSPGKNRFSLCIVRDLLHHERNPKGIQAIHLRGRLVSPGCVPLDVSDQDLG